MDKTCACDPYELGFVVNGRKGKNTNKGCYHRPLKTIMEMNLRMDGGRIVRKTGNVIPLIK